MSTIVFFSLSSAVVFYAFTFVLCNKDLLTYLRELQWLNIPGRIQFQAAVTVYRCLNGLAPTYLTKLCLSYVEQIKLQACRLRSLYCHKH